MKKHVNDLCVKYMMLRDNLPRNNKLVISNAHNVDVTQWEIGSSYQTLKWKQLDKIIIDPLTSRSVVNIAPSNVV